MFKFALHSLLTTALLTASLLAVADRQGKVPKVGIVFGTNPSSAAPYDEAFRRGLRGLGYVDGNNITILSRYAQGDATRYPALVHELIALDVDVLFGTPQAMVAAKEATSTVPMVSPGFPVDPVSAGLVASLSHPGGNLTGLYPMGTETDAKRLQLALELLPGIKRIGLLYEANILGFEADADALRVLAKNSGVTLRAYGARNLDEVLRALADMRKGRVQALIVWHTPLTHVHRDRIMGWSTNTVPVFSEGDWAEAGAVLTYSDDFIDLWRRSAIYVDRILKGAEAGDLPIERSAKFKLVLNLKAAKALGIKIPESLLVRADEIVR